MYSVSRMYHPSHRVPNLDAADRFFTKVFGRSSIHMSTIRPKPDPKYPDYPRDYSIFTPIADVYFDSIDPKRYVIDGAQRYEDITEPHLHGTGWGVTGIDELYARLVESGIRSTDQCNRLASPSQAPISSFSTSPLIFTMAEDTGLRYEFYPIENVSAWDPRTDPAWVLPPVSDSDPLAIEKCSHHTVLTTNLPRALNVLVTILDGRIIHEDENDILGTRSTYVALADGIFEIAEPVREGSHTMRDWQARQPEDTYYSLVWKVSDLDRVRRTLSSTGVKILEGDNDTIYTDPQDSLGVPWGFTWEAVPGDPR